MTAVRIVLASASSARIALLQQAGVQFDAIPADLDEDAIKDQGTVAGRSPAQIAIDLAIAKARHVSLAHSGALTLGSDQILVHQGAIFSKPKSTAAARVQLETLRGDSHELISAAALVRDGDIVWQDSNSCHLHMRAVSDAFLDDYMGNVGELVLNSVGCYHLEGLGAQLFDRVEGDYFTVLGLPLLPVLAALRQEGALQT